MSPAEYVIYRMGGVCATARKLGRDPSAISKWQNPKDKRGLDGKVPSNLQKKILEVATELQLDIKAEDLIFGRKVKAVFE